MTSPRDRSDWLVWLYDFALALVLFGAVSLIFLILT